MLFLKLRIHHNKLIRLSLTEQVCFLTNNKKASGHV